MEFLCALFMYPFYVPLLWDSNISCFFSNLGWTISYRYHPLMNDCHPFLRIFSLVVNAEITKSVELEDGIIVDYTEDKRVVSIEILDVKKKKFSVNAF
jgi:hypothetical protein